MKILFLISALYGGGAERVCSLLSSAWVESGNNVTIVVTSKQIYPPYILSNKVDVKYLSKYRKVSIFKKIILTRKIILDTKPDICLSFYPHTDIIALMSSIGLKINIVVSERNYPKADGKTLLMQIIKKVTYGLAAQVVFQTEDVKLWYSKKIVKKVKQYLTRFLILSRLD